MMSDDYDPSATGTPKSCAEPLACLFCGAPEFVEIHEIWGHEFMLQTCCEGLHEQIVQDMDADPFGRASFYVGSKSNP
jgi:hypothetical protein